MAKLRHLAIACKDPDTMADFYVKAFDFKLVRSNDGPLAYGHHVSDGTIDLAICASRPTRSAAAWTIPGCTISASWSRISTRPPSRSPRTAASTTWTRPKRAGRRIRDQDVRPRGRPVRHRLTPLDRHRGAARSGEAGSRVVPHGTRAPGCLYSTEEVGRRYSGCPDCRLRGRLDARHATAPSDPGPRDRRSQTMGEVGRGHHRGTAQPLCAIRRAGVPPPGAERSGTRCVLRPVRGAGAHCAQRLGLARRPPR